MTMSDHKELCEWLRVFFKGVRGQEHADGIARQAAALIEAQAARIAELERSAVRFEGIDPLNPATGASLPMIPESWRYAFFKTDHGLTFGFHDNGPFVAWDAVQARIAELDAQVVRDDEHYTAAMTMSEKHRRNWVEAAQRVAELEAERFADVYTAQMVEIAGHQYALRPNAAAEITALRAKPRAKRLVWSFSRRDKGSFAQTEYGTFIARKRSGDFAAVSFRDDPDNEREIGNGFATESEARAACQQEFDRIYVEMTEQGP